VKIYSEVYVVSGECNEIFPTFANFSLDLDKIQHSVNKNLSTVREFRENRSNESHTFLTNVNELVSILCTF